MKVYTIVALATVFLAATLLTSCYARNSTWGYIGPYDTLLYRSYVVKKYSIFGTVSHDVVFPQKGHKNYNVISGIRAIDRERKHGGHASLYRGGPGWLNATIHLKSEAFHGLNFTVEIFGRRHY